MELGNTDRIANVSSAWQRAIAARQVQGPRLHDDTDPRSVPPRSAVRDFINVVLNVTLWAVQAIRVARALQDRRCMARYVCAAVRR